MILVDSRTTALETVIDTQEFYKMVNKLPDAAKERLFYMMKGIELIGDMKATTYHSKTHRD